MSPPQTRIAKAFAKSPYLELGYRTLLWLAVGWFLASKLLYALPDESFHAALSTYLAGIKNWDQLAVIALVGASIVYALRSLEYFFTARFTNSLSLWASEALSFAAKVSGDIALGVFGAGVVIFATLSRAPTRLESDASGYAAFAGVMSIFALFVSALGICYIVGRVGPSSWLYRWQQPRWWTAVLLSPGFVLLFVLCYAYVL